MIFKRVKTFRPTTQKIFSLPFLLHRIKRKTSFGSDKLETIPSPPSSACFFFFFGLVWPESGKINYSHSSKLIKKASGLHKEARGSSYVAQQIKCSPDSPLARSSGAAGMNPTELSCHPMHCVQHSPCWCAAPRHPCCQLEMWVEREKECFFYAFLVRTSHWKVTSCRTSVEVLSSLLLRSRKIC